MNQDAWRKLKEWLYQVFPPNQAGEMLAEHIEEAREIGGELPDDCTL